DFTNSGGLGLIQGARLQVGGNFTQTAAGGLSFEIAGDPASGNYGQLNVTGTASLAGTLDTAHYTFLTPFTPSPGQQFPLLTFNGSTGDFATKDLQYAPGQSYQTFVTPTQYIVTVAVTPTHLAFIQQPADANADQATLN